VSLKVLCMFTLPVNAVGEESIADPTPRLAKLTRLRLNLGHVDKSRELAHVFVLFMRMMICTS
jgi:hypothetical protein